MRSPAPAYGRYENMAPVQGGRGDDSPRQVQGGALTMQVRAPETLS